MNNKLKQLNKKIIKCRKCPRLINFIKKISTEKRKQNINETYWGKPVPGFGKINSKLLILGLALVPLWRHQQLMVEPEQEDLSLETNQAISCFLV